MATIDLTDSTSAAKFKAGTEKLAVPAKATPDDWLTSSNKSNPAM